MMDERPFQPDWVSPPGETIIDILKEKGLSKTQVAKQIDWRPDHFRRLLEGKEGITSDTANLLAQHIGGSTQFWISREKQYRLGLARLEQNQQLDDRESWIQGLPISDMIKFGWIKAADTPATLFNNCLAFFGVENPAQWREQYASTLEQVAYRTSPIYESKPGAVAAWLRQGEVVANSQSTSLWNESKFRRAIPAIRSLTRKKAPEQFLPELIAQCANCGVIVAIVRAPAGCRASGATRFLSKDKALIQLSFRYLSDDHFWFTFFHEAGHLIMHGKDKLFIESDGMASNALEAEANDYSASLLVPDEYQEEMHRLGADAFAVIRFARKVGVSPGIIVGQMQHLGLITRRQLNRLKRRYAWV